MFIGKPASITISSIEIKTQDLPNFEGFNDAFNKNLTKSMKKIGLEGKEFWTSEAGRRLNRSRKAYQNSITVSNKSDGSVRILLGGPGGRASKNERWLAKAVETGIPMFDMKPGLLSGMSSRVIPLDTDDAGRIFRTVKAVGHEGKWLYGMKNKYPGLTGINLQAEVIEELNNVIIPKHIKKAFDDALKSLSRKKSK